MCVKGRTGFVATAMAAAAVDSCLKGGDIEMKKKARDFFPSFFLSFPLSVSCCIFHIFRVRLHPSDNALPPPPPPPPWQLS